MNNPARSAYTKAISGGAFLWIATALASGKAEAWDSSLYWMLAYPLTILLAGALGYRYPEQPWRWALAAMLIQPVILVFTASGFGLLPLGLILFAVLALPAIAVAQLGAWLASRNENA